MASEKTISQNDKIVMFTSYSDGSIATRYFDKPQVLAAWIQTMTTMKTLGMVDKYDLFKVSDFPANAVVTA